MFNASEDVPLAHLDVPLSSCRTMEYVSSSYQPCPRPPMRREMQETNSSEYSTGSGGEGLSIHLSQYTSQGFPIQASDVSSPRLRAYTFHFSHGCMRVQ